MNTNGKRYSANWTAFLGILVAGCFLAAPAQASPLFTGKFQLEHPIHWGNAVLQAGPYCLEFDSATQTIVVSDGVTGKPIAREPVRMDTSSAPEHSKLLVAVRGNQRAVYELSIAGIGKVYENGHPFAGVRAEEAQNTEAVRVEVAQK